MHFRCVVSASCYLGIEPILVLCDEWLKVNMTMSLAICLLNSSIDVSKPPACDVESDVEVDGKMPRHRPILKGQWHPQLVQFETTMLVTAFKFLVGFW